MTEVKADQLLYSRVEADYSPKRSPGYQVVYRGQALKEDLIEAILPLIQSFPIPFNIKALTQEEWPIRYQYFRILGRDVITHTVIVKDQHIVDSTREAFLVHALIFNQNDFSAIGGNPWTVIKQVEFVSSPQVMVDRFGKRFDQLSKVSISPFHLDCPKGWSAGETEKIVQIIPSKNDRLKYPIEIASKENLIEDVLHLAALLAPPESRPLLTFNTYIGKNSPSSDSIYWAVGTNQRSTTSPAYIDSDNKIVRINTSPKVSGNLYYRTWVSAVLANHDVDTLISIIDSGQTIATAFLNEQPIARQIPPKSLGLEIFFITHRADIVKRWEQAISSVLDLSLTQTIVSYIELNFASESLMSLYRDQHLDRVKMLSIAATSTVTPPLVSIIIIAWLLSLKRNPSNNELKQIKKFAESHNSYGLMHLAAIWNDRVDTKLRDNALNNITLEEFTTNLSFLMKPCDPEHYVHQKFIDLLLQQNTLKDMNSNQLVGFLTRLIELRLGRHLEGFASQVNVLNSDELVKVEKFIKKYSPDSQIFEKKVRQRRDALGKPKSFIKKLFRRK